MFFLLFFGLKLTNIGPRSTTRDKNNGKNNIKTTKTHFHKKGDNVKNNKTKVEIEGSTSNNRICTQQTLKNTLTHMLKQQQKVNKQNKTNQLGQTFNFTLYL